MYLDEEFSGGGGGPVCPACKHIVMDGGQRVDFPTDTDNARDMTGLYHSTCAKPFASMARALNTLSRGMKLGR